ncbi:MAG: threonylcarbamoyl-AMP synthase [Deltaproteobacteria bacterium]|nr:threonylcarbamoyl-AMP synthase [Deltaproteobacteria bacterium]
MTLRLTVEPKTATFRDLAPAAEVLLDGGLIVGPTQSFYAFMALADKPQALERIAALKAGRAIEQPFLLLIDSVPRAACYAQETGQAAKKLMDRFWPGLLTLLFTGHNGLHPLLLGKARTVGLRVEGLEIIRRLIRLVDRGLTGTSANIHKASPPTTADEVLAVFDGQVDLILDTGPTSGRASSTIVDVSGSEPWIFRQGAIPLAELESVCPDLKYS